MGKRSPILGYNHNVRYRGLVFHVQTEDSGVASPHLFTHLFHHGVIVSTRKLVYDAGSAEEAIKSLMQAQHKAVLKDLRRGQFDDKIDSYLGGTPGLLPRGADDPGARASDADLGGGRPSDADLARPGVVAELASSADALPTVTDELSAPVMIFENTPPPGRPSTPTPLPRAIGERLTAPLAARSGPVVVDATVATGAPTFESGPTSGELEAPQVEVVEELDAAEALAVRDLAEDAADGPPAVEVDLSPDIEIQLDLEDGEVVPSSPRRATRDTDMELPPADQTIPTSGLEEPTRRSLGTATEEARRAAMVSDGVPGAIRPAPPAIPPPPPDTRRLGDRPSTINAATLPPARPISRPPSRPSMAPPQVLARPLTSDDRNRRESDPIEVFSPAPPSAELPSERRGQYAQHKRAATRAPTEAGRTERASGPVVVSPPRQARVGSAPPANRPSTGAIPTAVPNEPGSRGVAHTEPLRSVGNPRTGPSTPPPRSGPTPNSVVMTRPAVIVGAPAKSVGTMPRIRKAREEEGRGFGQGLISEKSLDEVILAYLSEDAEEK